MMEQNPNRVIRKKKKRKKRYISARFLWLILFLASIVFAITFWRMPMFPTKWSIIVVLVLAMIDWLTFILTSKVKPNNVFAQVVNTVLAVALIIVNIALPYYTDRLSNIFSSVLGNEVRIGIYVMTDAYKEKHKEVFANSQYKESMKLVEYQNATFITALGIDGNNQNYTLEKLRVDLKNDNLKTVNSSSVQSAVKNLYTNQGDVLLLSDSYLSTVLETDEFKNFKTDTKMIGSYFRKVETTQATEDKTNLANTPFTLFIAGNDQPGELSLEGRTDVDIAVTVNPNMHQILITNLPRDSYIPNPAYKNQKDKLTHLGLSGIQNTLKGASNLLGADVNYYMLVNFTTFEDIINAIDGVDIDNPFEFTTHFTERTYPQGILHLDGELALEYVRERYSLPNGDFDRNLHQQIVLSAIIHKLLSPELISSFNNILSALQGKFLTNVSTDSIYALCKKQLDQNIQWNIVKYHLDGDVGNEYCASAPDQVLSVVYLYQNQVDFINAEIDKVINDGIISQETLPEGINDHSTN